MGQVLRSGILDSSFSLCVLPLKSLFPILSLRSTQVTIVRGTRETGNMYSLEIGLAYVQYFLFGQDYSCPKRYSVTQSWKVERTVSYTQPLLPGTFRYSFITIGLRITTQNSATEGFE